MLRLRLYIDTDADLKGMKHKVVEVKDDEAQEYDCHYDLEPSILQEDHSTVRCIVNCSLIVWKVLVDA